MIPLGLEDLADAFSRLEQVQSVALEPAYGQKVFGLPVENCSEAPDLETRLGFTSFGSTGVPN
jgi:hypothetical protein